MTRFLSPRLNSEPELENHDILKGTDYLNGSASEQCELSKFIRRESACTTDICCCVYLRQSAWC
jgi:hypothetical protein